MQELGYLRTVRDAQADKGEDAQLGVELSLGLGTDLLVVAQQGVEAVHEVGEDAQEDGVEVGIKFVQRLVQHGGRSRCLEQLGRLARTEHLAYHAAEGFQTVHIRGTELDEAPQVVLLDGVGLAQVLIGLLQVGVHLLQLGIEGVQTVVDGQQLAPCKSQPLHLPPDVAQGKDKQQGQDGDEHDVVSQRGVALVQQELIGLVYDGQMLRTLPGTQAGVVERRFAPGEVDVMVGALHFAIVQQSLGQHPERGMVLDGRADVRYGRQGEAGAIAFGVTHPAVDQGAVIVEDGVFARVGPHPVQATVVQAQGFCQAAIVAQAVLLQQQVNVG